ncbi:MAG: ankyrin repeat domain-containing protein [Alphaproteobacteria bacterium]|nr:ankyrin repeat domain-containing protein [Alphaproteobacteria bacterium]
MNFNDILNKVIPFRKKRLDREFICACADGDLKGVKRALKKGADINAKYDDVPAILSAVSFGHNDVAMYLAQNPKTDVNASDLHGTTPLFWAIARGGMSGTIKALMKREDIDTNRKPNWMGASLLHEAVLKQDYTAVRLLSENPKTNMNVRDAKGQTPLHLAVTKINSSEIVRLLVSHPRVKVNALDMKRQTPLHVAAFEGKSGYVKHLLSHREIDPNIQDIDGNTPFHLASMKGHEKATQTLAVSPKVYFSVRNRLNATAEEMASGFDLRLMIRRMEKIRGGIPKITPLVYHSSINEARLRKQKERDGRGS